MTDAEEAALAQDTLDRLTESADLFCHALRTFQAPNVELELSLSDGADFTHFFAVESMETYLAMVRMARARGTGDFIWKLVKDRQRVMAEYIFHV